MAVFDQLVIDGVARPLAHFWAEALHYVIARRRTASTPGRHYRSIGVPEDELGIGVDSIEDPNGEGPRIWFQIVPEKKTIKNRLTSTVNASGGRDHPLDVRRERSRPRPSGWSRWAHPAAHRLRGGPGPLRGRDGRSRGQRVRQSTRRSAAEASESRSAVTSTRGARKRRRIVRCCVPNVRVVVRQGVRCWMRHTRTHELAPQVAATPEPSPGGPTPTRRARRRHLGGQGQAWQAIGPPWKATMSGHTDGHREPGVDRVAGQLGVGAVQVADEPLGLRPAASTGCRGASGRPRAASARRRTTPRRRAAT